MKNIFAAALLAAAAAFAFAVPATAGIVSVSAAGPGGTANPLNIVTIFNTNDAVIYGADFTADAPIYITITLSAGGSNTQFFLAPGGNLLTNNSGVTFSNFYMDLLGYPPGTTLNGGGTAGNAFALPTFNADATEAVFSGVSGLPGGPGLPNGFSTTLAIGISLASPPRPNGDHCAIHRSNAGPRAFDLGDDDARLCGLGVCRLPRHPSASFSYGVNWPNAFDEGRSRAAFFVEF